MPEPLVTVIIPCYNAERWLPQTLASVFAQSHANLEMIAMDDGSSDGTSRVLGEQRDDRLKCFRQPNAGAAAARNFALTKASGRYIQFLDADDILDRDKIRVQVAAAAERGAGWIFGARWGRFYDDVAATHWEEAWNPLEQRGIDWLVRCWSVGDMMPPHGWLVPREIVEAIGPWDRRAGINDDGEYFTRALLAARGAVQVPQSRVHYRSGNPSYSQRKDAWAWESLLNSYESCARHLLAVEDSPRVRHAIAARLGSFRYSAYPAFPELVRRSTELARRMQLPVAMPHGGGRASRIAGRLIGWKLTRRLGTLLHG